MKRKRTGIDTLNHDADVDIVVMRIVRKVNRKSRIEERKIKKTGFLGGFRK